MFEHPLRCDRHARRLVEDVCQSVISSHEFYFWYLLLGEHLKSILALKTDSVDHNPLDRDLVNVERRCLEEAFRLIRQHENVIDHLSG